MQKEASKIHTLWANGIDICPEDVKIAMKNNTLLHLDIDFTAKCDLNCFYCDRTPDRVNAKNRKAISIVERKDIISQAKELGVKTVEVPGAGEPLLDKFFWETVDYLNELGITPVIFSSGYLLNKQSIDKLFESNVTVFLKYNHTNPNIQDKMVGKIGYGEKVNEIFQLLQERGFNRGRPTRLAIDAVITPRYYDIENTKNIFRYCRNNNIHFCMTSLIPEGSADSDRNLLCRKEVDAVLEEFRLIDEVEFGIKYIPIRPMIGGYFCNQVNIGVHINLYGEVYDCNGLGRFLGHVRKNSLEEIWNSRYARHIRLNFQNGYCLPRERMWDGIEEKGVDRKIMDYFRWKMENGRDDVIERGLEFMGLVYE